MPFVVGETLGPYRITEQLGQGGMATVFKAYHAALDRYVAIKVLHLAFKDDVNFLARFQREARVVAKLDHPNIVPIYDFAEHEGRPYLVMKYIEGETLKARLSQQRLSNKEILRVVEAVGNALTFAHRQGILHRDVKPSNVLLASDGQIYLADFGLARIAAAGESTLSSDMMLGTPQYISPEQAMGKRDLDEGTDIYSFGVLLYELLVGKVPFSADTPYAIIHDHIYSPLPMPRSINPKISEDVERVLLKALAKERTDRYPTVMAMVDAFKNACGGLEESALVEETDKTHIAVIPDVIPDTKVPALAELAPPVPEPISLESVVEEKQIPEEVTVQSPLPVTEKEAVQVVDKSPSTKTIHGLSSGQKKFLVIALIALGVFGLGICALFGRGILKKRIKEANPTTTQVIQQIVVPIDMIQAARQKVNKNPDDPIVHLDLAVLLIDAQQYDEASKEFQKVEGLINDFAFYVDHGKIYRDNQKWIASAWAFLHAMELKPDWKTPEALVMWREAVYKAFNDPNAMKVIILDRIRAQDAPMAGVVNAEAELVSGNPRRAELLISEVNKDNSNFVEALLVQARVLQVMKNNDRAVNILDGLKLINSLPPWIRDEIARIENVGNTQP